LKADAADQYPEETRFTIGLLVTNLADRRLLFDFFRQSDYAVRAVAPQAPLPAWQDISLIIADERAARRHMQALLALKQQDPHIFLPLLIMLPEKSASTFWLNTGFDDVLRLPVRKAELMARLRVLLRIRGDAHAQAQVREALRTANDELHLLTQKVVTAQEAERQHLARELHDEIGQALTAVNLNLQALQLSIPDAAVATRLNDSLEIIEHALNQVRDLSLDLHPSILDDLGLVAALQWYLDRQAGRTGLTIQFRADPPELNLPPEVQTTCFRITQEALTNIVRHANAHQVRVELYQAATELELRIRDDGAGFDVQAARQHAARGTSLGLIGMQERVALIGGRLALKSAPGTGTELRVRFPLPAASERHTAGRRRKTRHNAK
jgi:signal transduction histidine kinase